MVITHRAELLHFPDVHFKFQDFSRMSSRIFKCQDISSILRTCRHPVMMNKLNVFKVQVVLSVATRFVQYLGCDRTF
jgi:hypothetical protein